MTTRLRLELVIVLGIWYTVFVMGDVGTTAWLIANSPRGIAGEINPIGVLLFRSLGVAGLIAVKMAIFLPYSTVVLYFDVKFRHIKWFKEALEAILLAMIDYSLIILLNNLLALIAIAYLGGSQGLMQLLPLFKLLLLLLSVTLSILLIKILGYANRITLAQTILAPIIIVGPLLFFDKAFTLMLQTNIFIILGYITGILALLTAGFYIADELLKHRTSQRLKNES